MRLRRWLAFLVLLLAASASIWWFLEEAPPGKTGPYSHKAFTSWLAEDRNRADEFRAFEGYLAARKLGRVVPAWQLTRTDAARKWMCPRPTFLIPPREKWGSIVPVLRLVRDEIVPAVGAVEVVSSYRTQAFNGCIGGANKSRHLGFAAVDLIVPGQRDSRALFRKLCAIHRRLGPKSALGLGAYFDPAKALPNRLGRFHVDVSGFRSWGYSKHSGSSGCRLFEGGKAV